MIVSRFTTFTENLVICCNQITKIFCTRYDSANASPARGLCDFGPLAYLAISVLREVSIDTVFTKIHTSRRRRLWRWLMRRTGVRISVFWNFIIHWIFSEFLQPFRYVGMTQVSPFLIVVFVFLWLWIFGWLSQQLLFWDSRRTRISPELARPESANNGFVRSIGVSFLFGFGFFVGLVNGSPRSCLSACLLDTAGIYPTQVCPCSGAIVAWHSWRCHGWWGSRTWGRHRMINFLPWRCHGCWRRQAWGRRTCW